jgi:hypothetical protein
MATSCGFGKLHGLYASRKVIGTVQLIIRKPTMLKSALFILFTMPLKAEKCVAVLFKNNFILREKPCNILQAEVLLPLVYMEPLKRAAGLILYKR